MGTTDLCNDDPNQEFRIELYQASTKGDHKLITSIDLTMNELEQNSDFEYEIPKVKLQLQ